MSYPRKLHVLIVEDDTEVIEGYRVSFDTLRGKFQLANPAFVRSFSEAKKRIDSPEIFHIVILDMNLPIETRREPAEGLALGEQLLEMVATRDSHPVPVLLVVSGKLNLAQPISSVQTRLENDFWYGRLVNKGVGQHHEIESGLNHALAYLDVGIHIRDSGEKRFPTLSPREEDLLRRCVLKQPACLGVDLGWWSAETGTSISRPSPRAGPTKVLMGEFLIDGGVGPSIPTFFKFEPAGNGPHVHRDLGILTQKLAHVKVLHTAQSRMRSLSVTQSVTNHGPPVALNDYLQRDPKVVAPSIAGLIQQVVQQLNQLGSLLEDDEIPLGAFLWSCLDRTVIEQAWNCNSTQQTTEGGNVHPLEVFDTLKQSPLKRWAKHRSCIHGDLNSTNIAIDASRPESPQAYIFDSAGMGENLDLHDLAYLEVTSILFNSGGADKTLIEAVEIFYQSLVPPSAQAGPSSPATNTAQNIWSMILAIRTQIQPDEQMITYALLVFDAALRQLFGLAYQPNKVKTPIHACLLASWIARWLKNTAPQLFQIAKE